MLFLCCFWQGSPQISQRQRNLFLVTRGKMGHFRTGANGTNNVVQAVPFVGAILATSCILEQCAVSRGLERAAKKIRFQSFDWNVQHVFSFALVFQLWFPWSDAIDLCL